MSCERYSEQLSDYLNGDLPASTRSEVAEHMEKCVACAEHLRELEVLTSLLRTRRAPSAPPDLAGRIHDRLATEPLRARRIILYWPSVLTGAVAAAVLMTGTWAFVRNQMPLPAIQTAAVGVASPVSVNIGFDVKEDVEDVTYTIELPRGLQFVDADNQPLEAQSVTWQGALKRGKTVVPITVRGVQPGRYEIMATVRKNQFARTTKIILPVSLKHGHLGPAANG